MINTNMNYNYKYVEIGNENILNIKEEEIKININPVTERFGVMIVGIGGNNGSTLVASLLAHKKGLSWENRNGIQKIDFLGSIYQYGSINIGYMEGKPYTKLIREMIELKDPNDIIIDGWDIREENIYEACKNNKILDPDLLNQLKDDLIKIKPIESVYYEDFIATNQKSTAKNIKKNKDKWEDYLYIKSDIQAFKIKNNINKVVVLWVGSTERFSKGNYKSIKDLERAIKVNDAEISPSIIFAAASISEQCIFINGSPQNTINSAILKLAKKYNTFVAGDDLKTGQTKLKSVLVDYLASSGMRPLSIVSYNHLGCNDGLNLSEKSQFESKELTKKNVIDDIIDENPILFDGKRPDHEIVIKYIPAVGDSKRAIDEYNSELFLDGRNNLAIHNICEDTKLAVPLMLDIIIFSEFLSRIRFEKKDETQVTFSPNLSLLSFFFKAPIDDENQPIVNAFFPQIYGLKNFIKACLGLPICDYINLHKRI